MNTTPTFRNRLLFDAMRLYRRAHTALHDLTYLMWECTLRCNLRCRHCGSDCRREPDHPDMPLADFLRVVDQVATVRKPAKTVIVLTGGEPLCRPDLAECGAALSERGFPWGFVSNGYGLGESRFQRFLDAGLRTLSISLDGLKDSHEWLRNTDGAFDHALRTIRMAAGQPSLAFDVITCITQKNLRELEQLKQLLIQSGVRYWRLINIFPKGRATNHPDLDVSAAQFRELMEFIKTTRAAGEIDASYGCEGFLGPYERQVRQGLYYCRAGINVASVLADGSITGCTSLRDEYVQGNIYRDDFLDVWNHRFERMRDRSWARTGICADCASFKWCQGNGLHLRDGRSGELARCHLQMLQEA